MINQEQKKNYISELSAQFKTSKTVMVTHSKSLTMTQLNELSTKLAEPVTMFKMTNKNNSFHYS
mgnify:CR=1 FL=1